jgi:hypothetical protein
MPRIKELVRIATLGRHVQAGIVSNVEIIGEDGGWSVRVRYKENARGGKIRFLTSKTTPGPKRYVSLDTVWRIIAKQGISEVTVRAPTATERKDLCG